MNVVMIGAGNVSTHMALGLQHAGCNISQVWSRSAFSAQSLSERLGCEYTTEIRDINSNADIYIYAVADGVLETLSNTLSFNHGLHLHTAGSVSLNQFAINQNHAGVVYPFQTFSKTCEVIWDDIPIFIESREDSDIPKISSFAQLLSSNVFEADSVKRLKLHLSGVFACNFSNHLFVIVEELLRRNGLPFSIIEPLIKETFQKLKSLSPKEGQTGPAVREDVNVMIKHQEALADEPSWQLLYKLLSDDIIRLKSKKE